MCYEGVTIKIDRTFIITSIEKSWLAPFFTIPSPTIWQQTSRKIPCECSTRDYYPYLDEGAFLAGIRTAFDTPFYAKIQIETDSGIQGGFRLIIFLHIEIDTWLYR